MTRTRAVPRNLRRTTVLVAAAAAAAVARLSRPAGGVEVKSIENNRRRNKDIKIKKLLPQTKNTEIKQRGRVGKRITVRRSGFFLLKDVNENIN